MLFVLQRIPLEDVYAFWDVLTRLNEVEHAITFWTLSGAPIDKDTFKHVTRIVGKIELNEHLVEVLFQLFDDNGEPIYSRSTTYFTYGKSRSNDCHMFLQNYDVKVLIKSTFMTFESKEVTECMLNFWGNLLHMFC